MLKPKSLFSAQYSIMLVLILAITFKCINSLQAQNEMPNGDGSVKITQIDTVMTFDPETKKEGKIIVKNEIDAFVHPEIMPVFRDCKDNNVEDLDKCTKEKIAEFIEKNLKYPENYKGAKGEATVFVRFIITDKGEITLVNTAKSDNPELNLEAWFAIFKLNKAFEGKSAFYPGKSNGKDVNVKMIVPVNFTKNTSSKRSE